VGLPHGIKFGSGLPSSLGVPLKPAPRGRGPIMSKIDTTVLFICRFVRTREIWTLKLLELDSTDEK